MGPLPCLLCQWIVPLLTAGGAFPEIVGRVAVAGLHWSWRWRCAGTLESKPLDGRSSPEEALPFRRVNSE